MLRLFIFSFAVCGWLAAQTTDTATLQGQIFDPSRAGVADVHVTIRNALTGFERSTQSDSVGRFSFNGVPVAGSYKLTASKQGFADAVLNRVTLSGGTTANLSIQLNVAGDKTQITVTGIAGEVRTDSPQLGTTLDTRQIEQTPLLN